MDPLRVVVSGAGAHIFSAAHTRALDGIGAQVVGVHDVDHAAARRIADRHGWPVHGDLDGLLAVPADVAVVTAPHPHHAELVLACLRAGRHVLVEKPLAVRADEADAVVAVAGACGLTVAVALQHRFRREVEEARRLIRSGFLGQFHRAEVVAYYPKRSVYFTAAPWRGTWSGEGGGVLINQGQHDLDTLIHLTGPPARVFGWVRTRVQPTETEDTVEAVVEWAGGATGSIHVSSAAGGPPRIELTGTAGTLRLLPGALEVVEHEVDVREFSRTGGDPFDRPAVGDRRSITGGGGTHTEVYRDLADALATGRPPRAPARDAVAALELTNAVTLSSHRGAPVELPLDRDAYRKLLDSLQRLAGTARGRPSGGSHPTGSPATVSRSASGTGRTTSTWPDPQWP